MDLFTLASGSWWYEFWNSIWLLVCQGIYIFIGALYQVYEKVASVNLFSTDVFEEITGRIYIVMGIAMLFIFAYNLILLIINPDEKKGTSNMTKVIKETIISLVLVILLPTIFNYLYVFQSDVLESNIIGNIVLGNVGSTSNNSANCKDGDYDCTCNFEGYGLENYNNDKGWRFWASSTTDKTQFITDACNSYKNDKTASQRGAYAIAPTIFSAFYRPANFDFTDCVNYLQTKDESVIKDDEDKKICVNYFYDVTASKYTGNIRPFSNDTYLKDIISDSSKESMEFHWIMAVVAGGLAVYMFLCYAMEVGVRVAKLGFLQLISPIPVMMRIIPGQKEKIFTKWLNHMKTTYLDVFIRVLIIDFALFGISLVPDVMSTLWNSSTTGDGNFFIKALATVFVILGILKFAQDAPALFKEFFGDAGSFKLRSPGKQLSENKLAMGGVNAIKGGIYGATTAESGNRLSSFFSGAGRGAIQGYDKAVTGLDKIRTERANGSTFGGRFLDRTRTAVGMETRADADERRVNREVEARFHTKDRTEENKNVQEMIDKIKSTVDSKLEKEDCKVNLDFSVNGKNYNGMNYASLLKLRESMQNEVDKYAEVGDTTNAVEAQKRLQQFTAALEKRKKEVMTAAVTEGMHGSDYHGLLNKADQQIIQEQTRNINRTISESKVGLRYDENGGEIAGSTWTDSIDDGAQIFSDHGLRDTLTEQRANISERSDVPHDNRYKVWRADSNVVKKQERQEKK